MTSFSYRPQRYIHPWFIKYRLTIIYSNVAKETKKVLNSNITLHKKWSFPLGISSVNVTKSAEKLRIWSHLLKKSVIENFDFCAVSAKTKRFSENLCKMQQKMKISIEDFYSQCKNLFFLCSGQKYGLHSSQVSAHLKSRHLS